MLSQCRGGTFGHPIHFATQKKKLTRQKVHSLQLQQNRIPAATPQGTRSHCASEMNQLSIFLWIFAVIYFADASGYEPGRYPEDVSSYPTTMPRSSTFAQNMATHQSPSDGGAGGSGHGHPQLRNLSSGIAAAGQRSTFTSGTQPHPTYIGIHSNTFGNTGRQEEVAILADALSGLTPGGTQPSNVGTALHQAAAATDPRPSSMTTRTQQQQTGVVLPLPSSTITQHSSGLPPRTPTTRRTITRLSPLSSGSSTMTQQQRPPTAQNPGAASRPMMTSISTAAHQSHHQTVASQYLPTLSRPSQSPQRQQLSGRC